MECLLGQRAARFVGGWGGGRHIRTVYIDGREALWASDPWPEEIVAAWQEMLDVMKREAGQE
jgi:hypothetical protein